MIGFQLVRSADGSRTGIATAENLQAAAARLKNLVEQEKVSNDDLFLVVLESADGDSNPENVAFSVAPLMKVSTVLSLFPSEVIANV